MHRFELHVVTSIMPILTDSLFYSIGQVLMHAQLRDNNQGIVKITSGGLNRYRYTMA